MAEAQFEETAASRFSEHLIATMDKLVSRLNQYRDIERASILDNTIVQPLSNKSRTSSTSRRPRLSLTSRDFELLEIVRKKGPLTADDLIDELDLGVSGLSKKSTISQTITKKLKKTYQLLTTEPSPDDKRKQNVRLTAEGYRIIEAIGKADFDAVTSTIRAMRLPIKDSDNIDLVLSRGIETLDRLCGSSNNASIARVYDYFIGGDHYLSMDKAAAKAIEKIMPSFVIIARSNRAFVRRACSRLAKDGMRQFIDVGSGFLTPDHKNVHDIVQSISADSRTIYVDRDYAVVDSIKSTLNQREDLVTAINGNVEYMDRIIDDSKIDVTKPVVIIMAAVLHFVLDDDVILNTLRTIRQRCKSGGYIVVSHGAPSEDMTDEDKKQAARLRKEYIRLISQGKSKVRSKTDIVRLFCGFQSMYGDHPIDAYKWMPEELPDGEEVERYFSNTGTKGPTHILAGVFKF